jgi:precorrin-6Y C5,15-methyltransferase (decarboxylating)
MITVVGVDGRGLSPLARARLEEAAVLAGPDRVLERVRPLPRGARVVGGPLGRAVEAHREHGGRLVVLAGGDPGFFGAVAELRGHGVVPEVIPAPSLVSQAFAKAGLAWEDALVVSGGRLDRVANACRAHHKVAVLVAPGVGPAEIARELAPTTPRSLIVYEDLGGPDERITHSRMGEATTRPWKNPEVVLVLDPLHRNPDEPAWVAGARPGPPGWARDFAGAGLDPVVRAFVLARLGPRLGDLVWDVGAGGGEIAVECALLGAAVVAVEPGEESCARLRRNVIAHGVKVALARGRAPAALEPLADPDAVFVGGGGTEAVAACAARGPRSLVCALRTGEQVTAVLEVLREHGYRAESVRIEASRTAGGDGGEAGEETGGDGGEAGGEGGGHRPPGSGPVFVVCATGRDLKKIIIP